MEKKFTLPEKFIVLFVYALFMVFRLPEGPLFGGHIVIEDATVFLAYAWHSTNIFQSIFHQFAGYLNITANISAFAAVFFIRNHFLSLRNVPIFFEFISILFQMIPAVLLLWGRADWLQSRKAVIMSLLVVAVCPKSDEVWLNVMHIQFWLMLSCAIILVLKAECRLPMQIFRGIIIFIAPLSGPASLFLGPFFLLRSFFDRSFPRLIQTAILGFSGLIQIFAFYKPFQGRVHHVDLAVIINGAILRTVIVSCLNPFSKKIGKFFIYLMQSHDVFIHSLWISQTLIVAGLVCFAYYIAFRFRKCSLGYMVAVSVSLILLIYSFGAIVSHPYEVFQVGSGRRYQFVSVVFVGFAFIAMHAQGKGSVSYKMSNVCLVMYFISGFIGLFHPVHFDGPKWDNEIALWEKDHNYRPLPHGGTPGADLSDAPIKACSGVDNGPLTALAPSYCEENWRLPPEKYCLYKKTFPNLKTNYGECH